MTIKPRDVLPHRAPFLLLDSVEIDEGNKSANATWTPRKSWPIFRGHFPDQSIVPGVVIVEVMAQAACILGYAIDPSLKGQPVALAGIDRARFRRPVRPGDQLKVKVEYKKRRRGLWSFQGRATVENIVVADADFMASVKDSWNV